MIAGLNDLVTEYFGAIVLVTMFGCLIGGAFSVVAVMKLMDIEKLLRERD